MNKSWLSINLLGCSAGVLMFCIYTILPRTQYIFIGLVIIVLSNIIYIFGRDTNKKSIGVQSK